MVYVIEVVTWQRFVLLMLSVVHHIDIANVCVIDVVCLLIISMWSTFLSLMLSLLHMYIDLLESCKILYERAMKGYNFVKGDSV